MKPLILISNDDGFQAKGINELINMVADFADVVVCAPEGVRSGKSRAFSMEMLTLRKIKEDTEGGRNVKVYACSGTPVDCIKMAYNRLCPRRPDLILGGINHGDNSSTNAHYSGTVGIAIEGAMKGIPSIAFSLCDYNADANFMPMRELVRSLVKKVLAEGMPHYAALNVNYPLCDEVKGVKVCRMAHGRWRKEVEKQDHPTRGYSYYWMCGFYQYDEPEATDTDAWALHHGYAAITPITVELTDFDYLKQLENVR